MSNESLPPLFRTKPFYNRGIVGHAGRHFYEEHSSQSAVGLYVLGAFEPRTL